MTARNGTVATALMAVLALLLAAVCVQGYYIYRLHQQSTAITGPQQGVVARPAAIRPAVTLVPTTPSTQTPPAATAPQTTAGAKPGSFLNDPWFAGNAAAIDPFAELDRIREHMDLVFQDSMNRFMIDPDFDTAWADVSFSPQMDFSEEADRYVVRLDLPGVDKSDMNVSIDDRVLTVAGETDNTVEKKDGNKVLALERRSGSFERSIMLPGPVDAAKMEAAYDKGVLTVSVPKAHNVTQGAHTVRVM